MLLEILKEVRLLLSSEEKWTSGFLALSKSGKPCDPTSKTAIRWCLAGAIAFVSYDYFYEICAFIREHFELTTNISDWSDSLSYEEVIDSLNVLIGSLSA